MTQTYPLKCRIRAGAGATRVDVYDDIGPGSWFPDGLTAKDFAAQLADVRGALEVHINSGGGDVFDGIAIRNAIAGHTGRVTTVVDGLAASIASVIAQAGERIMQPGSMMMIHDAFGMAMGNAADMRQMADTLDAVSDNIAGIYADRAGGTAGQWRDVMRGEAWYTADDAVAAGLADRVGAGRAELPPGVDMAAYVAVPGRIAAALRSMPSAATGRPYEPAPYHVDSDETVVCPKCEKRNDTDARYCDQCGTKLVGREDVREAPVPAKASASAARFSDSMPDSVREKFTEDLKHQPVHEIGAAIHRLAEWSASGHYPAGMSHADIQWMYSQCSRELHRRNPDSEAGGNLPASDVLPGPGRFADCHFLVEATTATAASAGHHDHADAVPGVRADPLAGIGPATMAALKEVFE